MFRFSRLWRAALFGLIIILCACKSKPLAEIRGETMGTTYSVKYRDPGKIDISEIRAKLEKRLYEINASMSTYIADSEISKINRSKSTHWQPISVDLKEVLAISKEVSERTDGAFDVTIGAIVNAWGFGPNGSKSSPPSDQRQLKTLTHAGSNKWDLNQAESKLRKNFADIQFDLSAVAKGFAVDELGEELLSSGIQNYMVEIGGEIKTAGYRSNQSRWRIAIEKPDPQSRSVQMVIPLSNLAMASSGDYRNYFEYKGKRYSHTIDPKQGEPISHNLTAVSVIHPSCAFADAYATALLVLGPTEGYSKADRQRLSALFLVRSGEEIEARMTGPFKSLVN